MTNRDDAMSIVKRFYRESLGDIDLTLMIEEKLKEAERRGFERGFNKCKELSLAACTDFQHQVNCNDPAHDERYCSRCSAMDDAADLIQDKIESLQPPADK